MRKQHKRKCCLRWDTEVVLCSEERGGLRVNLVIFVGWASRVTKHLKVLESQPWSAEIPSLPLAWPDFSFRRDKGSQEKRGQKGEQKISDHFLLFTINCFQSPDKVLYTCLKASLVCKQECSLWTEVVTFSVSMYIKNHYGILWMTLSVLAWSFCRLCSPDPPNDSWMQTT